MGKSSIIANSLDPGVTDVELGECGNTGQPLLTACVAPASRPGRMVAL